MTVNGQIATTIVHTDDYTGYVSPDLIINKENLLNIISKERDICASTGHKAGGINYTPATEDWQKAIGAFNFCMSADVSATEKKRSYYLYNEINNTC